MGADVERFPRPTIPWIWELVPGYLETKGFRWVVRNAVMVSDCGVTIRYARRRQDHEICGARTMHPGYPNSTSGSPIDHTKPYETVCTIIGDHSDTPHLGVPADCADMTCDCSSRGSYHLVIAGITITAPAVTV